jgi:hypothetical protein
MSCGLIGILLPPLIVQRLAPLPETPHCPSTINHQPSTINHQLSTLNCVGTSPELGDEEWTFGTAFAE